MIRIDRLRYEVGAFRLEVSLEVQDDEYFVLFGMTGCGKTSLLECVCGLRTPAAGTLSIGGADVTCADPGARRVGYVPQDGALFPHLSVRDNIAFSLRVHGVGAGQRRAQAAETARRLGIEHLLDRGVDGLSGGERQRVALGRALVGRPMALVLDEPVSALDQLTRNAICRLLVGVQRSLRIPVVHVCHSFEEASLVADRVGVMCDGRIAQVSAPAELLSTPRNAYVARLSGLPNVFAARSTVKDAAPCIEVGGFVVRAMSAPEACETVEFIIRPWDIFLVSNSTARDGLNIVEGTVRSITTEGSVTKLAVEHNCLPLTAHVRSDEAATRQLRPGAMVTLGFSPAAVQLLGQPDSRCQASAGP